MTDFVALDFETATSDRTSICQIGITEVKNGVPQKPLSWLVKPEYNKYNAINIAIHGISPDKTKDSPSFPEIWKEVRPYLDGKIVVAHNTGFDMYALRDALDKHHIEYPTFDYYCTLRIAKYIIKGCYSYSLGVILEHLGFDFAGLHDAGMDSFGCAVLMLSCLKIDSINIDELEAKYNFHRGFFASGTFSPQVAKAKGYSYKDTISNLTINQDSINEGNYFYGKTVCFTGTSQYGTRNELMAKVAQVGGIPVTGVTAQTNILVVGQQDYKRVGESGLSSKQKKALDMLNKGFDIEILSEIEFYSRL